MKASLRSGSNKIRWNQSSRELSEHFLSNADDLNPESSKSLKVTAVEEV
jgi:hypothetical protein